MYCAWFSSLSFLLYCLSLFNLCTSLKRISSEENKKLLEHCDSNVKTRQKRMMNGTPVKKGDMKYAVMLDIGNGSSRCSGVLISRQHVLTAAHCFVTKEECRSPLANHKKWKPNDKANTVYVHYGGYCVVVKPAGHCPRSEETKRVKAVQMGVPARYFMSKCRSGDIAIVELETALPESADYYDMACLPTRRVKLTGRNLISAGYGYDPDNVAATEKHMEKVIYSKEPFCDPSIKVGKDAFCVVEKGQFACKGDSGSGVMQPASKLRDYVMGVLAIGLNCNDVQVFMQRGGDKNREYRGTVITNVRKYLDWICFHSGICVPPLNTMTAKKEKMVSIY